MNFPLQKVLIIGVGLIGGSLGLAIRRRGLAGSVAGFDRDAARLERAVSLSAIDKAEKDLKAALSGADLVFLAVPVGSMEGLAEELAGLLSKKTVVTDVGSVKGDLVGLLEKRLLPNGLFVGGHPIAGREKSGVEAASAELFEGAVCLLTPTPRTDAGAQKTVEAVWTAVGSRVVFLSPQKHDRVAAAVSHLPHVVAYALVACLLEEESAEPDLLSYSAGGFRDFTRIASSSPQMWREICLANGDQIVSQIERYQSVLERFRKSILNRDGSALEAEFERARAVRERLNKGAENKK
jgi:prephenate dehydrogenase